MTQQHPPMRAEGLDDPGTFKLKVAECTFAGSDERRPLRRRHVHPDRDRLMPSAASRWEIFLVGRMPTPNDGSYSTFSSNAISVPGSRHTAT
jgi:hypothetical protein